MKRTHLTAWLTTALMLLSNNANADDVQWKIDKTTNWFKSIIFNYINDWSWPLWKNWYVDMWNAFWFELLSELNLWWKDYKLDFEYTWFINDWDWRASATKRSDKIWVNIQKEIWNWIYLGWWIQTYWKYLWEDIQNWIHSAIWDTQIENAKYWESFLTPTINATYSNSSSIWEIANLDTTISWEIPLIPENWTTKIEVESILNKNIWPVNVWLWASVWYNHYPDKDSFSWFPLDKENWIYSKWIIEAGVDLWENTQITLSFEQPISWWMANSTNNSTMILWIQYNF